MKYKTLGDVVEEAINEYSQEHNPKAGKFEKAKNSLEHFVAKNSGLLVLGSTAVLSGLGYYALGQAGDYMKETYDFVLQTKLSVCVAKLLLGQYDAFAKAVASVNDFYNPAIANFPTTFRATGLLFGGMMGFNVGAYIFPRYVGGRIYFKIKGVGIKHKIGKIFRYPATTALALTTAINLKSIIKMPSELSQIYALSKTATTNIMSNKVYTVLTGLEVGRGLGFLMTFGCFCGLFYIFRDIENGGKKMIKNFANVFLTIPPNLVGIISKEKKIKMLRKLTEKKDTEVIKNLLEKTLFKKSLYDGFDYCKDILDEEKNSTLDFVGLKKWSRGSGYSSLFQKKENWAKFFSFLSDAVKDNPEAARKIIDRTRKATQTDKTDVHFLLNYLDDNYIKITSHQNWIEFTNNIIKAAEEDDRIQEFKSSEGKIYAYTGSKLIKRNIIIKTYNFDFFERFLKQKFEYEALRGSEIKTENPLAFIKEGKISRVLSTREGDMMLAEFLKNKDKSYKRIVLERAIEDCMLAQKILYEKTRKENGNACLEVVFGNKNYSLKMDELDLIKQLYNRAFIGDERRGLRWGENEHLAELMGMIIDYTSEKYNALFFGISHGDFSSDNIVINTKDEDLKKAKTSENFKGKLSRIDPRHVVTTATYDPTHLSFSSGFNEFEKDEIGNDIFKGLCKIYNFTNHGSFQNNFNCLYLLTGLGISAAYQARGEIENGAIALDKILEFSKDKSFGGKLWLYLKDSRARPLLKII